MTPRERVVLAAMDESDEQRLIAALRCLQGVDTEPLLSIEEVSKRLDVSPSTIYRHDVPVALKVGGQNRYRWSEVEAHFRAITS